MVPIFKLTCLGCDKKYKVHQWSKVNPDFNWHDTARQLLVKVGKDTWMIQHFEGPAESKHLRTRCSECKSPLKAYVIEVDDDKSTSAVSAKVGETHPATSSTA